MLKLSRRIENAGAQHQEDATTIHESEAVSEHDPVCEQLAPPPYSSPLWHFLDIF